MSYAQNLMLFWLLLVGIIAVPGLDMLLVLTHSLSRGLKAGVGRADHAGGFTAFRQGALTAILNPKAYVFVLSVYPQVLRAEFGPLLPQALVAGAMTAATQLAIYGGIALAAGRVRRWLLGSPRATILTGRVAGGIFLVFAALTVWQALAG